MELNFNYIEHLKEYCVEEESFYYYMPISYILRLQTFCEQLKEVEEYPVNKWYHSLKDIERKIVIRKFKDDEKLCSI